MASTTSTSTATGTTTTSAPLVYSLELTVLTPTAGEMLRGRAYYRVRFEVNSATNLPCELFVHQRLAVGNATQGPHDEFVSVAGPLDLTRVPVGSFDERNFHRLAYADILIESIDYVTQTVQTIQDSLQNLANGLTELDKLSAAPAITITPNV